MVAVNEIKTSRMKSSRGSWLSVHITLIVLRFNFHVANVHCRSISMQMEHDASRKACPALALMRTVLYYSPEKKSRQQFTNLPPKQALRFSSIEFCQCKFDERNTGRGLGGSSSHMMMNPLLGFNRRQVLGLEAEKLEVRKMVDCEACPTPPSSSPRVSGTLC